MDQLPVRLPVGDRIRCSELLHHPGGDEEDEEGKGQHTSTLTRSEGTGI